MTYREDLEYAKKILKLLQETNSNGFKDITNLMVTDNKDEKYLVKLDTRNEDVLSLSKKDSKDTSRSSDNSVCCTDSIIVEYGDSSICITENDFESYIEIDYPIEYTEEIHFQNSTIYNENQNRLILLCWYLNLEQNRLPGIIMFDLYCDAVNNLLLELGY